LDRFYELRQYYADQLVHVITTLIVRFEGNPFSSSFLNRGFSINLVAVTCRPTAMFEGVG